jgi:hypothetical protein
MVQYNTHTVYYKLTSIPTTLPKNILFSAPQLGHDPLATKGSCRVREREGERSGEGEGGGKEREGERSVKREGGGEE